MKALADPYNIKTENWLINRIRKKKFLLKKRSMRVSGKITCFKHILSPAYKHDQNDFPTSFVRSSEEKLHLLKNRPVKANAGALTNFEVLDLLNSRGASKDTTRVIASETVSRSEYKVYDYLMETAASTQTRESVTKFSDKCKDFKLAKAEILNIINLRPSSDVELTPILEKPDEREIDIEGILALVQELLPPLPTVEAQKENEQEETENDEQS
ncbi:unnamed protein product [Brassica oleracea]